MTKTEENFPIENSKGKYKSEMTHDFNCHCIDIETDELDENNIHRMCGGKRVDKFENIKKSKKKKNEKAR